ncbi:MAG: glycosyltransferase family 2 protein [Candidatus Gastranaerophilales bacterium]|nr:glycosyltransferase family 2 protein [Candidatus Gastranaerophilales bacterium]
MTSQLNNDLDIFVITYNRAEKLKNTLEQIFSEGSPIKNLQITILNNASTDETSNIIEKYKTKYKNLKHIINKRNIGGNANIIRAYESAEKKYIWVLCDDDDFDWTGFGEIENAIANDYDVILTRKCTKNIADLFYKASFVPAAIYKTSLLTTTVITNAYDNISNLFPHLAIMAKCINTNVKIYYPKHQVVNMGIANFHPLSYIRGNEKEQIPIDRQNMFWTVGYLSSIQLIRDRKKQIEIINGLRHGHKSLYDLFKTKILLNKKYYQNSPVNIYKILRNLSLSQKIRFYLALLSVNFKCLFSNTDFITEFGEDKWKKYFEYINEQKYINSLAKKYNGKKVLIYGAGTIANVLFDKYNLSKFNIVAISDLKYTEDTEYKGYTAISPNKINELKPEVILFTLYEPANALNFIKKNYSNFEYKSLIKKKRNIII